MPRVFVGAFYSNSNDRVQVVIGFPGNGWTDEKYRTVTFLEPPTGDLLTWLQANAVKQ